MAAAPAQSRPKGNKPRFKAAPTTEEGVRARRATANRVLTMLKAALNHAYDEGHIANRDAWGRKLKPFRNVEVARVHYLTVAQAGRLLNACDADFRPLVQATLETGCRYSELTRLVVDDFNPDASTITIGKSKSGKARHVILRPEGADFFASTAPVAKALCFAAPTAPPGTSQSSPDQCARLVRMPAFRRRSVSTPCATLGRASPP